MTSSTTSASSPTTAFPLRVAAVDVGSNAIRFAAAEFTTPTDSTRIDSERVPLRLGTDTFQAGELAPETMDAAVAALTDFRRRMDALGVLRYRAVATSAVRESRNSAVLEKRAWEEAGVRLEIIPGSEEAGLVWRAVREQIQVDNRPRVMVDLGGGSVEVSLVDDERVVWSESEPLGTIRLLEEMPDDAEATMSVRARLEEFADRVRYKLQEVEHSAEMIAVGGNIEAIAELMDARKTERGVRVLTPSQLREALAILSRLSCRERVEKLGLRKDRADVILPAVVVYAQLADAAETEEIRVPDVGVKEGVLLDQMDAAVARREASPTRVAFLSDIHANLPALRAALEVAEERGAGRVVVAGDLVGDGPHPVEVVRLLRAYGAQAIRGNVDRKVLALGTARKELEEKLENGGQKANRVWAALQLRVAEEERTWLEGLPPERWLDMKGTAVLIVHGSPHGDTDYIYPSLTPEGLASKLEPLEGRRPTILVCGHSHVPFAREVDGVWVLNCGSVGRPADGDPRGSLVLMDLDGGGMRAEVVRFGYPMEALVSDLEAREVPGVEAEEYRRGVKL